MAWENPKTNWGQSGQTVPIANDFNRIEGNIQHLQDTKAAGAELDAHKSDKANPHNVTKAQIGLGNVQNYGIATQAEAEAGTVNNKYMTPLRTLELLNAKGVKAAAGSVRIGSNRDIIVGFTPKLVICTVEGTTVKLLITNTTSFGYEYRTDDFIKRSDFHIISNGFRAPDISVLIYWVAIG